ncbi:antichymotrypsin-2-like isoform X2 [Maniola hyperantus]|uniref:antichymotrypsin-2-like isoform X2 n=1 Tax=Aphantopus hyperantus TaxID=2795564 RepID=UPI003747A325
MKLFYFTYFLALATMASGDENQLENLFYEGNNKFSTRMFSEVANTNPEKSFVLSAYSVLTPLAQLSLASVDEAHDELLDTIGMPDDSTVEEQTNSRIKDLVDPASLTADIRALLVNAIYFKGTWKKKFDEDKTFERVFYKRMNVTTKVQMMHRNGDYMYGESQELKSKIIEIPYQGDESSLVVVLPLDIEGINEVKEILKDPNVLENALKNMTEHEVELSLPKFKIETTTDLKDVLIKMKVTKIFNPHSAKLNKLIQNTGDLYIDSAKQKAFIEVNEEGAEAGAANEFGVSYVSLLNAPRIYVFFADHPFIFSLREGNNTLFSGAFYN